MADAPTVWERTMKIREMILRAVSRELTWMIVVDRREAP